MPKSLGKPQRVLQDSMSSRVQRESRWTRHALDNHAHQLEERECSGIAHIYYIMLAVAS